MQLRVVHISILDKKWAKLRFMLQTERAHVVNLVCCRCIYVGECGHALMSRATCCILCAFHSAAFRSLHSAPCMLSHLFGCILRISIHAQRTLTSRSSGAVLVRRVHLRHSPARPERTAYVYIFNADSQVRPHAAILAPPPACACLRSSRRQPMHPRRPLACAHTVGHSCFSASAFRLPIRLDCMRSVCRGM